MNLTTKIFLGTAAVVTTVLGATLVVADQSATKAADATIGRSLTATTEQVSTALQARQTELLGKAEIFAQNPGFRSLIATKKPANALDQATVGAAQTQATWVQFTDELGVRLARSDDPTARQDTLSGSALIGGALEGRAMTGYSVGRDTGLAQVIAVPILQGDTTSKLLGTMMAVQAIDTAFVRRLQRSSSEDVDLVFFSLRANNTPHVVATTLGGAAMLEPVLSAKQWTADSSGRMQRTELTIKGEMYVGQGSMLRLADGSPAGGFLALRSRASAFAPFRALRQTLLLGAGLGLVVAFLLSFVVARGITRPVASLAVAAKRAAEGDYLAEITGTGGDEIGRLAGAFNALLSDLRDKQQLVELLQAEEARRTVPIEAMGDTMQLAIQSASVIPGQRFARRYDVKEVLGAGGMGTVYKAVDAELGEVVAIKTLKPDFAKQDASALERFRSEIRLARKISHRNVVRTHDIGEVDGTYYITMEYAEGRSLKDIIRQRGKLPAAAVVTIGRQLCRALEVAHEAGVIHRDIKPQNIVVGVDGVLKVMDFGIARLATRTEGVTQAGMVVGTPEYMAPEQLLGDDVDARVDIYAAGAVLFECLTGHVPHEADSPITLIAKVLEEDPKPPRLLVPEIPVALSDAVVAALSRDRDHRPATAAAFHDLLDAPGVAGGRESGAVRRAMLTPTHGT